MGYNRSGTRRTQRQRRHKKLMTRLLKKGEKPEQGAAATQPTPDMPSVPNKRTS